MTSIILEVEYSGARLDRYLSEKVSDLSRSRLQQLIEQGHLTLNSKVCTGKKTAVNKGDRIYLKIPAPRPLQIKAENIPLDILYEDDSLIVINKPPGLVVHPAPGHPDGTLVNAILFHCPHLSGIGGVQRPGIVHRLDKDTTGAIVVAKTEVAHQHLQAQLKAKTARRDYLGIVYGAPSQKNGTINLPIGRHRVDRKKMAVTPLEKGGRNAVTNWQIKERLGNYSLIHFQLETGRTHQIRVHAAHIGHPIVGDTIYGSGRSLGVNLHGQVLHAWRLCLQHPISEEYVEAIAPLPDDFNKLLQILRKRVS
ncbi:MAG: RluA family pseudouridine synthase [Cyanobacteria bacterium P01_A01_bin.84]